MPRFLTLNRQMVDRERLWDGDHGFFAEVIREHNGMVKAICQSYADSPDEVDDLLQEIWTQVYVKRRSFSGSGAFPAWVQRMATRYCIDVYRKKKATEKGRKKLLATGEVTAIHGRTRNPERDLARREAERTLWEALDALPGKERESIVLRLLEQRSPTEVGEAMGIEQASVRSNISRGIKRLRGIMGGSDR
ncbi:MAG: sigma-70 family RNA polymerase sigma factor [Gemmatimonadetes bacterium]|nr:sigma-70 family RNA polymerase sigma factor [Gemmatimonadota bacterium]NNM05014.1 sigma-70 family RNA polymerase sigma factor [Gemmatimonadota bacterium]